MKKIIYLSLTLMSLFLFWVCQIKQNPTEITHLILNGVKPNYFWHNLSFIPLLFILFFWILFFKSHRFNNLEHTI